ncbi:MAG: hypothetical protein D6746_04295 [Bacteroidetes bacterium]|nr:MAG: hypothetical protein D6746_04295 [Bacteroidota bacterium]
MRPTYEMKTDPGWGACRGGLSEALELYLDGELSADMQPALFAHLAECAACRRHFEAVLAFRRMCRQEYFSVPPAAEQVFFEKLARHRAASQRVDRTTDRRPLWHQRAAISLRVAVLAGVFLFLFGLMLTGHEHPPGPNQGVGVVGEEERVDFSDRELSLRFVEAVYVFYPGLTIEASPESASGE